MDYSVLKDFGLTELESRIYLTILQLGEARIGDILKKTNMHKATAYSIINRLVSEGYLSYVLKGKSKVFIATDPEVFAKKLEQKQELIKTILPDLKKLKGSLIQKNSAMIFEGQNALQTVLMETLEELNPNGSYVDFGFLLAETAGYQFFKTFQNRKKKYGIKSKCLFDERVKQNKDVLCQYYGKVKFLPKKYYSNVDFFVFNDKLLLFVWKADPPFVVKIISKDLAKTYLSQFNALWKIAKK